MSTDHSFESILPHYLFCSGLLCWFPKCLILYLRSTSANGFLGFYVQVLGSEWRNLSVCAEYQEHVCSQEQDWAFVFQKWRSEAQEEFHWPHFTGRTAAPAAHREQPRPLLPLLLHRRQICLRLVSLSFCLRYMYSLLVTRASPNIRAYINQDS